MARYIGRHLMIRGKYVDSILAGTKTTTIRIGVVKPRYREIIIHGGGRPVAKAVILSVKHKKIKDLVDEDARMDGFRKLDELLEELRNTYGELKPDDTVTIISFKVVENLLSLKPEEPYLGLNPVDIARIALRYIGDKLPPLDKELLEELTRSGSIRSAALRKYGDVGKRYIVRRALRRAIAMLLREGILGGKRGGKHI